MEWKRKEIEFEKKKLQNMYIMLHADLRPETYMH